MQISLSEVTVTLPATQNPLFQVQKLEIPFGSKVLIEGASGKGKTTLLHLMAGLFLADKGIVQVGNYKFSSLNEEARAAFRRHHMGFIFQKLNLIDYLNVFENVKLGSSANNDKIKSALQEVDLLEKAQIQAAYLSLGEQQRTAVARVVASAPEIILADEPTSSLDAKNASLVMNTLLKATEHKTMVVVSHDHRIREHFDTILKFEELVDHGSL